MPSPRARRLSMARPIPGAARSCASSPLSPQSLVIQIRDSRPDKAKAASWVGADHLEIWTLLEPGDSYLPDPAKLAQLGIGLDGTTHAGTGKAPVPQVRRWTAKDEQGRPVTIMELHPGARSSRWRAGPSSPIRKGRAAAKPGSGRRVPSAKNRPGYLPTLFALPVACGAVDGNWLVTKNPGKLNAPVDVPERGPRPTALPAASRRHREPAAWFRAAAAPCDRGRSARRTACVPPALPSAGSS